MTTTPRIEVPTAPGLVRTLTERKRLIIGVVAVFASLGLALNAFTPPVYRATVRIEFPRTAEQTPWTGERAPAANFQSENMALFTSAELITNRVLLGRLAGDLDRSPSAQLALANAEKRRAAPWGWLRVPNARASAARLTSAGNGVTYDPAVLGARVQRLQHAISVQPVADTRLVDIRVEDSEPELAREAADRLANLFVAWQQERVASTDTRGLSFVAGEIARVKARIEATSAELARHGAPRTRTTYERSPISAGNASTLSRELLRAEGELANARGTYREAHPKVQAMTAEVAAMRSRIAAESRPGGSTSRAVRTLVPAPRQAVLENDLAIDEAIYARLQSRAREIDLEQQVATPAVTIVEPASVEADPIRPRPLLNLAMCTLAGLLVAVGLALTQGARSRTIRSARDAEHLTGLPVLAVIAKRA